MDYSHSCREKEHNVIGQQAETFYLKNLVLLLKTELRNNDKGEGVRISICVVICESFQERWGWEYVKGQSFSREFKFFYDKFSPNYTLNDTKMYN